MKYRFGRYEIDVQRHELLAGGVPQPVEPQVFDLLKHMVENRDRLVSHDELVEVVWGGRIVSESAISARISAARHAVGDDGATQAVIRTVPRRGFRFVAEVAADAPPPEAGDIDAVAAEAAPGPPARQSVRFCRSADGTQIAYATTGTGTIPLVRAGHWLTHLEHDWQSPVWRPILDGFGQTFRLTRYDQRGNGLSDWAADDFGLDACVDDLTAVVDAAGLDKFALYGASQGAPIAISYAARHPERVSHLVLQGGYARGRTLRSSEAEREQSEALLTLMRHGWGKEGSPFLTAFTSIYIPEGTKEQRDSLVELQRRTTTPENAIRLRMAVDGFDVTGLLADIKAPTLVMHSRDDGVQPLDQGRRLAAGIPGAEFVLLDSSNHIVLPQEPAWATVVDALHGFFGGSRA